MAQSPPSNGILPDKSTRFVNVPLLTNQTHLNRTLFYFFSGLWHQRATVRKHSYFLFALYDADRNSKLTAEEIYNYEKANNPYGPNFLFSLEEIKALIAQQDGSDGTPKDGQLNFGPEFDNYLLASIYKNLKGQYLYY